MIQVQTKRFGPVCVAATVKDDRSIEWTWGLTQEGAFRRLCRKGSQ